MKIYVHASTMKQKLCSSFQHRGLILDMFTNSNHPEKGKNIYRRLHRHFLACSRSAFIVEENGRFKSACKAIISLPSKLQRREFSNLKKEDTRGGKKAFFFPLKFLPLLPDSSTDLTQAPSFLVFRFCLWIYCFWQVMDGELTASENEVLLIQGIVKHRHQEVTWRGC